MQPPTEVLILDIIQKHRLVTADELSRILFMTKPNIHYHLKKMLQKRLVEVVKAKGVLPLRPGRPELFYRLSCTAAGNNITKLCDILLTQQIGEADKKQLLHTLAVNLLPATPTDSSMPMRLRSLVDELNRCAYNCRWEAHKTGPLIMFANCPYAPIIARHPELCYMDACILESYLKFPVNQITRIDQKSSNPTECQFQVMI
jgi:predicted ArsR family transcriptional regulator